MYLDFFGLAEKPFSQTPDPRFLYWNDSYREALASLRYGIQERKGFLTFIGEAGTGKTTLLRKLLEELGPDVLSVFLFNPDVGFDEILQYTLGELGIACPTQRRLDMLQRLNEFLLAAFGEGRNTVLLIDEAQDLDSGVLESLRLLSNLETSRDKILQIVLCGQPELARRLAQPSLRQLKQRIAVRCRLEPLRRAELPDYVATRTRIAGCPTRLFDESCMPAIWEFSGGIPRLVNMACDNALLVAYALGKKTIDAEVLAEVVHDLSRLDVMDLDEDFLDPATPARPTAPTAVPPPARNRPPAHPDVPRSAPPAGATPAPVETPAPRPPRTADLAPTTSTVPPASVQEDGITATAPAARVTSVRWVPWVGLAGVLLGAVLASNLPRSASTVATPRPVEPDPLGTAALPTTGEALANRAEETYPSTADTTMPTLSTSPATPGAVSAGIAGEAVHREFPSPDSATTRIPEPSPLPAEAVAPTPASSPQAGSLSLGPLENRRAMVRRGDTLSNLATQVYGVESLSLIDVLGRANPSLADLDHIEPGQILFFPEPRPEVRIFGEGENVALLVATTRDRAAAERIRVGLPPGLAGRATIEPGRLGSLRVYRVVVRDLEVPADPGAAARQLGPIFGPGSPEDVR